MNKEKLCISELASYLDVDRITIYRWIWSKKLPPDIVHREINDRYYFLKSEIDNFRNKYDVATQCI